MHIHYEAESVPLTPFQTSKFQDPTSSPVTPQDLHTLHYPPSSLHSTMLLGSFPSIPQPKAEDLPPLSSRFCPHPSHMSSLGSELPPQTFSPSAPKLQRFMACRSEPYLTCSSREGERGEEVAASVLGEPSAWYSHLEPPLTPVPSSGSGRQGIA